MIKQPPHHTSQHRTLRLLPLRKVPETAGRSNDKLPKSQKEGDSPEETEQMHPEETSRGLIKLHLTKGKHGVRVRYLVAGGVEVEGSDEPVSEEEED